MAYIVGVLAVLIGIIWALVAFPTFRIVALILVALGTVGYYTLSEKAEREQKQQATIKAQEDQQAQAKYEADQKAYCEAEQKRWAIVPPSQIELRDPTLTPAQFYGSIDYNFTVAASAKNKSRFKVTGLRLNITALDCPTQDAKVADCDIVGRSDGTFSADIPAGEVRQVGGKIELRDVPKSRGVFSPRFAVNAVRVPINQADDTPINDALGGWFYKCGSTK